MTDNPLYRIKRASVRPDCTGNLDRAVWGHADTAHVDHFRPEGASGHVPDTAVRLLYDSEALYALFTVRERYVRCVSRGWMVPTYQDSCVELFLRPHGDGGYFNFEVNSGGAFWCSYIEDWTRTPEGFGRFTPFTVEQCRCCRVYHSLPEQTDPEREELVDWCIELHIPLHLLETFTGPFGDLAGAVWSGNMYKCAERNSHPHWAAWAPVSAVNFHVPQEFGTLCFV